MADKHTKTTSPTSHSRAPLIHTGGLRVDRPRDSILRQIDLYHLAQSAGCPIYQPQKVPPELLPDKHIQDGVEAAVGVGDGLGDL